MPDTLRCPLLDIYGDVFFAKDLPAGRYYFPNLTGTEAIVKTNHLDGRYQIDRNHLRQQFDLGLARTLAGQHTAIDLIFCNPMAQRLDPLTMVPLGRGLASENQQQPRQPQEQQRARRIGKRHRPLPLTATYALH